MADQSTLYSRWLNGELSEKEINELKANGEDAKLENIIKALDLWESEKLDLDTSFAAQLNRRGTTAKFKRIIPRNVWLVAASVALLISCIYLFQTSSHIHHSAANGTNELIALSDGASAILNDGSSIKYKTGLFSKKRKVHLEGEALFKVTKGEKFSVISSNGNVEVLGTQFNVRTWGEKLKVECYEGQVRISNKSQSLILARNESVILEEGINSNKEVIINGQPDWMNGYSQHKDEPISEVFKELERQYDIEIVMGKIEKKFTGRFTHENLNAALESICLPLELEFNIDQEENIVRVR